MVKPGKRSWVGSDMVIIVAILIHAGMGLTFMLTDEASGATCLAALLSVFKDRSIAGAALLLITFCSCLGQWGVGYRPLTRFWLLLPQQSLFLISMIGAGVASYLGEYADCLLRPWVYSECVARPHLFIGWDQVLWLCMPIMFGSALFARVNKS